MKSYVFLACMLITTLVSAQKPEKLLKNAIPVTELVETEFPRFPGYKSNDLGSDIAATEDAVRGYFIRKLNMNAGGFEKKTIVKMQIQFVVGTKGEVTVTNMQSEFDAYVVEGDRVATTILPAMTPAYKNKKPVSVLYDFPLTFIAKATKNIQRPDMSKIEYGSKVKKKGYRDQVAKK